MLTGTPLDATPFGPLLSLLGLAYWALAIALVALTVMFIKPRWPRYVLAVAIAAVFVVPVARYGMTKYEAEKKLESRRAAATALFQERCKTAGERVSQTVEDVEGVAWLRWRSESVDAEDQFALEDFYGRDCAGEECIASLLRVSEGASLNPEVSKRYAGGFSYVEANHPDGYRYRYTAYLSSWTEEQIDTHRTMTGQGPPITSHRFTLRRERVDHFAARYGVLWTDISTREDRESWIAGGALSVVDLKTPAILAERVGYLADPGLGSTDGFRAPWGWAESYGPRCPLHAKKTKEFVVQALIPKRGE